MYKETALEDKYRTILEQTATIQQLVDLSSEEGSKSYAEVMAKSI